MATVGRETNGTGFINISGLVGLPVTFPVAADVSKITAYAQGDDGGTWHAKCALYTLAGVFVASTEEQAFTQFQAAAWVDFNFSSPVGIEAGDYVLVMLSEYDSEEFFSVALQYFFESGTEKKAASSYPTFASPVSFSNNNNAPVLYATYEPAAESSPPPESSSPPPFAPRRLQNKPGVEFNAARLTIMYAEDFNSILDRLDALEG